MAYDQAKYEGYFEENQNLECIGIGNIEITAKYLII
jgi:hypothetical protein